MMETLRIEFEQLPCGCWDFKANIESLHDVPPSVIRCALADELEMWETVQREGNERRREERELYERRN